ncbi:MAG: NfeD family protein [Armatimonadota bacterium]
MPDWNHFAQTIVGHPWWTIALLVAGCALLFHEMLTPLTWGWTGTLGLACVGVVFAAQRTAGVTGWLGIVLLLAGVGLLLVEILILPGRGVPALCGFTLLFSGMFVALGGTARPGFALPVSACLALASMVAFFAYLPKSAAWREIGRAIRTVAAEAPPTPFPLPRDRGTTLTPLRPTGEASFGGATRFVVTEGEFLPKGIEVVVDRIEGNRIVVDVANTTPDLHRTPPAPG